MKIRHLIATILLLLELPIVLPLVAGAVICGLLCGLQLANERARVLLAGRQRAARRPTGRSLGRPAVN